MTGPKRKLAGTKHRSLVNTLVYVWAVLMLQLLLAVFFGYRRHGIRRVPRNGPLLVVSNHQSYLDSVAVGAALYPRVATHLARSGLFKFGPFARIISSFNAVPIREEEGDLGAIRTVIDRLKLGDAVIIYPEGSRSTDGRIQSFRRGATLIAKKSGCTVLPVAIDGAFDAWPRTRRAPRLLGHLTGRRLRVMLGNPIRADDLLANGQDVALIRLENEVRSLHAALLATRAASEAPRAGQTVSVA